MEFLFLIDLFFLDLFETSSTISSIFTSFLLELNSLIINSVSSLSFSEILRTIAFTKTFSGKRSLLPSSIALSW